MTNAYTKARTEAQGRGEKSLAAFDAGIASTKQKVAQKLKENKPIIAWALGQDTGKLDDKTLAQMASDWVEKGEFKVGNETFTRDRLKRELPEKAKTLPPLARDVARNLGYDLTNPATVDKMLPTGETLVTPATRLSESVKHVEENSNTFWEAIKGFFSWVAAAISYAFSGFDESKKPGSITDHIYRAAGERVAEDFGQRMQQDLHRNPALAALISPADLADMQKKAAEGVAAAGRGEGAKPVTVDGIAAELGKVNPKVVKFHDMMANPDQIKTWGQTIIISGIDDKLAKTDWKAVTEEAKKNDWKLRAYGMVRDAEKKVKTEITTEVNANKAHVAKVAMDGMWQGAMDATDQQLGNKEALAQHMADAAVKALEADAEKSNSPLKLMTPEILKQMKDGLHAEVQQKVKDNYDGMIRGNIDAIKKLREGLKSAQPVASAAQPGDKKRLTAAARAAGAGLANVRYDGNATGPTGMAITGGTQQQTALQI